MWLNVGGLGWHHITWSGIGNSNIIILFNLLVMGGCFFSKSFERGESNILVLFFFSFWKIRIMLRKISQYVRIQFRATCSLFARNHQEKVRVFIVALDIIISI